MIYDETEWISLNHTHWMNASAAIRSDSIWKNLPVRSRHIFILYRSLCGSELHVSPHDMRNCVCAFVCKRFCSVLLRLGEDMPLILSEC